MQTKFLTNSVMLIQQQFFNSQVFSSELLVKNLQQFDFVQTSPLKQQLKNCSSTTSTSSASSVCSASTANTKDQQKQHTVQTQQQQQSIQTRYKTELCRSYQENGICKYGEKCQFAHGHNELRNINRHPKFKTELCRTFHAMGYCPYGPRCHFVHDNIQEMALLQQYQQQLKASQTPVKQQNTTQVNTNKLVLTSLNQQNVDALSCSSSASITPPSSRSLSPDYQQQQQQLAPQSDYIQQAQQQRPYSLLNRLIFTNPTQFDATPFTQQQQNSDFNLLTFKF